MKRWLAGAAAVATLILLAVAVSTRAEGITIWGFFTDDNGSTFEADIDAIAKVGITKGCNPPANDKFCPDDDVDRGQMAAFLRRALGLPSTDTDFFGDDESSIFEADINAIAAVGITKGCNPPANDRFCPNDDVDRGQMAAFLRRALGLPSSPTNHFGDDDSSTFEDDINAIAETGITKGCNPPANDQFCPQRDVTRGEMAAFLRRALGLPFVILKIPVGDHGAMVCAKDGESCQLTVDLTAGRLYRIQEGLFQVNPASASEQDAFNSSGTSFTITLDGGAVSTAEIPKTVGGGVTSRNWRRDIAFSPGSHTLVGQWRWKGALIQTNTLIVRAAG